MLTREQILQAQDKPTVKVTVEEWGGDVYVRTMSGSERDSFEQSIINNGNRDLTHIRAKLLIRCICDEQGNRIFTDDDIVALGSKSAKALDKLYDVASRLNGLSASDVEELRKN